MDCRPHASFVASIVLRARGGLATAPWPSLSRDLASSTISSVFQVLTQGRTIFAVKTKPKPSFCRGYYNPSLKLYSYVP